MINALKPHYREFGNGVLLLENQVRKNFKYTIVADKDKRWSTPTNNLITSQSNTTITTSWNLPFEVNQRVVLDGEPYIINRCQKVVTDINEQSLGICKNNYSAYWTIEVGR